MPENHLRAELAKIATAGLTRRRRVMEAPCGRNATVDGKKVAKGRYTLYAIAYETTWTFILNKDTDTWGAFKYDAKKDILRVTVPVEKTTEPLESLAMSFEKTSTTTFKLYVAWDTVKAGLPISL